MTNNKLYESIETSWGTFVNETSEKSIASKMKAKGYSHAIVFDAKDGLDNLYTKSVKQASELMRTDYKDKKNYKIIKIDEV